MISLRASSCKLNKYVRRACTYVCTSDVQVYTNERPKLVEVRGRFDKMAAPISAHEVFRQSVSSVFRGWTGLQVCFS